MSTYDFTGLTTAQKALLSFGGWKVSDAAVRSQPMRRMVARLVERGLLVMHKRPASFGYVTEYEVPTAVHIAWCERCDRRKSK